MLRFPAVNANKLRVRIDECRLTAYVSQVAAYYAEPLQEETTKEDWNNLPRSGWKQFHVRAFKSGGKADDGIPLSILCKHGW